MIRDDYGNLVLKSDRVGLYIGSHINITACVSVIQFMLFDIFILYSPG
jgi:hypothetical protein